MICFTCNSKLKTIQGNVMCQVCLSERRKIVNQLRHKMWRHPDEILWNYIATLTAPHASDIPEAAARVLVARGYE